MTRTLLRELAQPAVEQARLKALVPVLRAKLRLASDITDDMLLRGLTEIATLKTGADRWKAAFNSEIGQRLAARGTDLNTTLNIILGLVSAPRRRMDPNRFK